MYVLKGLSIWKVESHCGRGKNIARRREAAFAELLLQCVTVTFNLIIIDKVLLFLIHKLNFTIGTEEIVHIGLGAI